MQPKGVCALTLTFINTASKVSTAARIVGRLVPYVGVSFQQQKFEYESKLKPSGRLVVGGGPSAVSRPPARAPPTQPAAPTATTTPAVHVTPSTLTAVPPPWKTHNLTPPVSPPITNAGPTQTIFFVEEEIHFSVSSPHIS